MDTGRASLSPAGPCHHAVFFFDHWIISGALQVASCMDFVDRCVQRWVTEGPVWHRVCGTTYREAAGAPGRGVPGGAGPPGTGTQ